MNRHFFTLIFVLGVHISAAQITFPSENSTDVLLEPPDLLKTVSGKYNLVEWYTTLPGAHSASYEVFDPVVSSVVSFNATFGSLNDLEGNVTGRGYLNVSADFVGYNLINITIYDLNNNTLGVGHLKMSVTLFYERFNKIFTYILAVLIFIVYINMGATIDLQVVKQIVKRPVGPVVGIVCQYGLMPLFAFGIAKLAFSDNELLQLGMFLNGASPGGGASNMWTYLLGGSLDLSIMMTFVSTLVAFGAVPLWVLTLGPKLLADDSSFVIPYDSIAYIVVSLVIPCFIGLLIQKYMPKLAKFLEEKVLAPFSLFNIFFIFTVGVYSHRYIFAIFTWKIVLSAFALPGLGYLSGLFLALLARRSLREVIAISIETGVQNANIAIVILKFTLEHPAADLAVVMPTCGVLMTPIPLLIALIIKTVYGRFFNSGGKDISTLPTPAKEGIENGAINQIPLPDVNKVESSNGSSDVTKFNMQNKLFGVDNPAVNLDNDVL